MVREGSYLVQPLILRLLAMTSSFGSFLLISSLLAFLLLVLASSILLTSAKHFVFIRLEETGAQDKETCLAMPCSVRVLDNRREEEARPISL